LTQLTSVRDRPPRHRIGREVRTYGEVASTNDLAMEAARVDEREGLVIVADVQTAGRGRLGRPWHAPAASCLLMSMLFRPPEPFAFHAARTTMLCGLALREAVAETAGDPPIVEVQLKWPNDLIVPAPERAEGWAKLAGMLTEVSMDGGSSALVVGIGLNVNVAPASLEMLGPTATSLRALLGEPVDRAALLDGILASVDRRYDALLRGVDPFPAWRTALAWLGEMVEVRGPLETTVGIAEGVDGTGALLVRSAGGELRSFTVGDVSLRRGQCVDAGEG
jgi:BirA family transcriptional regulator, biotin operon repressor / biotin---[acetyl-CoA-carboxylase] ligase